jgi:hypothetical protein
LVPCKSLFIANARGTGTVHCNNRQSHLDVLKNKKLDGAIKFERVWLELSCNLSYLQNAAPLLPIAKKEGCSSKAAFRIM